MASALTETPQAVEVGLVKAAFPGRCRVVKDTGLFTHVVTLQPENMDATLKFQLTESYPATQPEISVRSESLTPVNIQTLTSLLKDRADKLAGQPMMHSLVQSADQWLRSHGVRPGKAVNANNDVIIGDKKVKKVKRRKKKRAAEEEEEGKKPAMKTAEDVIKRILWDDKLDKDDFLVGYLDRFKGVVEKYFSAFSWEDIAAVDYDVLAVPKHRIQYFKFRSQKIWDKPSRMDNVFGSTGSGTTVYDVIENYQESSPSQVPDQPSTVDAEDGDDESYDSDDDDDGITVTIGNSVNTVTMQTEADDEDDENDPYWQDKLRPNHFLAVRITDPEIRQGVEQIQDYILDNEPLFGPCCMPAQALHVTLFTLGLDTPQQIMHAKQVLERIKPEILASRPTLPLTVEGVSNFHNRVVYAAVHQDPTFMDFVEHLRLLVKEAGIEVRDNHEFVPHMTIMKVTRPVARQKGSKHVNPWLYGNFKDMHFGRQSVDAVYLCSMGDERRSDGFYLCPAEVQFV